MEPYQSFSKTSIAKLLFYKTKQNKKMNGSQVPTGEGLYSSEEHWRLSTLDLGPFTSLSFLPYLPSSPPRALCPNETEFQRVCCPGGCNLDLLQNPLLIQRPHSKWAAFLVTHYQDQSSIPRYRMCCLQTLKWVSRHSESFLWDRGWMQATTTYLERGDPAHH